MTHQCHTTKLHLFRLVSVLLRDSLQFTAVGMAVAALPGVFYVDDPQDGASAHLLSSIGVQLRRGLGSESAVTSTFNVSADAAAAQQLANNTLPLTAEHRFVFGAAYFVTGGSAVVDVRDTADAFVRIVLSDGDALYVNAGVNRRLGSKDVVRNPVSMPAWGENPDHKSRATTVLYSPPVASGNAPGRVQVFVPNGCHATQPTLRFEPGSSSESEGQRQHWLVPGTPHTRDLVVELCGSFYNLGWVTGTGGSISIRHGDRIFMAPSGVQKERMQPQDIFVLDTSGREIYAPAPIPGRPRLKLSQCAPLFQHAFNLRGAGACIHTHDQNAVMATLLAGDATEFVITHQEMIKGIAGHGFLDSCVVPIIENTPHECDLAESLGEAMAKYPKSNAILVRRHGVYVWGSSWEAAKTQAECYHYLFEIAVKMRGIGIDPGMVPRRVEHGIGAAKSYGSGHENYAAGAAAGVGHVHNGSCCGGAPAGSAGSSSSEGATSAGFHGSSGTNAMAVDSHALSSVSSSGLPSLSSYSHVLLDIEGCTTAISFVTDTLFPYAAQHARAWLGAHWGQADCVADVSALVAQSKEDVASGVQGAADKALGDSVVAACKPDAPEAQRTAALEAVLANIAWQMSLDRKTGGLKQLQGHIWRDGYASGSLKGHLYPDTVPALQAWQAAGKRSYIYSSGSREAQRLLFKHSVNGDVRGLLCGYFDTSSGPKVEAGSYGNIALSLGVDGPGSILFATDSLAEAVAAHAAGVQVVLTDRPGNKPLQAGQPFPVVTSLLQVTSKA